MTDATEIKIESLVLEQLRAIRKELADIKETLGDHGHRLTRIETAVAGVRRDQANDAEGIAHIEARFDRWNERFTRIERRLDIAEPT